MTVNASLPANNTTTLAEYAALLRATREAINENCTAISLLGGVITSENDLTIEEGTTSLAVGSSDDLADQSLELINLTAEGACVIASITGGRGGQIKTFVFQDTNVTITNGTDIVLNRTGDYTSAANETLTLINIGGDPATEEDGIWQELILGQNLSAAQKLAALGVTALAAELNVLDGISATTEQLNKLASVTASADELNILDGAEITTEQLNTLAAIDFGDLALLDEVGLSNLDDTLVSGGYIKSTLINVGAITISDLSGYGTLASLNWIASRNLVANGDFARWSSGDSAAPDGWSLTGTSVAKEETYVKIGSYSAEVVSQVGSTSYLNRSLHTAFGIDYWKGRIVSVGAWVKCDTAAKACIAVGDGVQGAFSDYHTGSDEWEWLSVYKTINASATELTIYTPYIVAGAGITAYCDGVVVVEGVVCPPYHDPNVSAPSGTGIIIDNDYIGFYKGGAWKIALDSSEESFWIHGKTFGAEGIQLEYNDGHPQVYFGDGTNGFKMYYDSSYKFEFSTADTVTIKSGGSLVIKDGGDISVEAGGDLSITGNDSDPAKARFTGSSYTTEMYQNTAGNNFYILPTTTNAIDLVIGNSTYKFDDIYLQAQDTLNLNTYYDATHRAAIKLWSTAASQTIEVHGDIYPDVLESSKTFDIGMSALAFDDAYADDWNNVADFYFFDDKDDLNIIANIKPRLDKEGNIITEERTGHALIDDDSLPDWMFVRNKHTGEIARDSDNNPWVSNRTMFSLHNGALREVSGLIKSLTDRINILETRLKGEQ